MGMLFRRGGKAMTDLVVAHVAEDAEEREIASFIRLIHHSDLLSKSDLVLVFYSPNSASRLGWVVKSECENLSGLSLSSIEGEEEKGREDFREEVVIEVWVSYYRGERILKRWL
uniref:DUF7780 domain-containing protein n=1 Tax=Opuntia streptacantha TaxID=393608 RepID=A0A7C9ECR9_OPUST